MKPRIFSRKARIIGKKKPLIARIRPRRITARDFLIEHRLSALDAKQFTPQKMYDFYKTIVKIHPPPAEIRERLMQLHETKLWMHLPIRNAMKRVLGAIMLKNLNFPKKAYLSIFSSYFKIADKPAFLRNFCAEQARAKRIPVEKAKELLIKDLQKIKKRNRWLEHSLFKMRELRNTDSFVLGNALDGYGHEAMRYPIANLLLNDLV